MEPTALYPAQSVRTIYRADGAALLLDLRTAALKFLSPEAAVVWSLVHAGRPFTQMCQVMTDQFEVDPDTARADVAGLLADFREQGLVDRVWTQVPLPERVADPDRASPVHMLDKPETGRVGFGYLALACAAHFPAQVAAHLPWTWLERLVRVVRRITGGPPDDERLKRLIHASRFIGRFAPQRSLCLESTLTTFLMGACLGHPPTWCLGARFGRGVELHSWSEDRDGRPVAEPLMDDVPYGAFIRI